MTIGRANQWAGSGQCRIFSSAACGGRHAGQLLTSLSFRTSPQGAEPESLTRRFLGLERSQFPRRRDSCLRRNDRNLLILRIFSSAACGGGAAWAKFSHCHSGQAGRAQSRNLSLRGFWIWNAVNFRTGEMPAFAGMTEYYFILRIISSPACRGMYGAGKILPLSFRTSPQGAEPESLTPRFLGLEPSQFPRRRDSCLRRNDRK